MTCLTVDTMHQEIKCEHLKFVGDFHSSFNYKNHLLELNHLIFYQNKEMFSFVDFIRTEIDF